MADSNIITAITGFDQVEALTSGHHTGLRRRRGRISCRSGCCRFCCRVSGSTAGRTFGYQIVLSTLDT
jgi:hypothetical protein